MYLNDNEKELISKEIENLEKSSSAELVAVIRKRSGDYKYIMSILNICIVFSISFFIIFFTSLSNIELLQIQLLIFIGIFLFLGKFDNLILSILPKFYKRNKASTNAQEQFLNLGVNRTKTNQAIMFFVSLDEKHVEIITDKTISEKIKDEYWQIIVDEFILDVKNNNLSKGYLKAINSCSQILIKEFPIQANDKNELSNDVIELR
ncbi:MAG: TPM domain-containing protein [Aliarcobacter sp.]|jgi:putative membrane protein|nr:TPM domain-containing protein [Aliarcobacter sp.]